MQTKKKARRWAFTLIEMLVTVAIIMVLAGLIIPAIRGARERSRDVLCKNRLKELQVASMAYAMNANGDLPYAKSQEKWDNDPCSHNRSRAWRQYRTGWVDWVNYACHHHYNRNYNYNDRRPGETLWWGPMGLTCITNGALWPYIKNLKTYACPEWQREDVCGKRDPLGGLLTFSSTNNVPWRNYHMNAQVSGANIGNIEASKYVFFTEMSNTNFLGATRISQWNMLENSGYTFNQGSTTEANGWDGCFNSAKHGSDDWPNENMGLYHNGKANAVFVDGHVEKLTWTDTTNACFGVW